ncbi:hypothetical protein BDB00DRAFT_790108 [Zychaea mexicana]|uniref:uncharacterized protein n=1 Tax=Zychaea mexicana TaxID=64656 RepID=UPI0022FDD1AC|nr:uncharacterized protein BDB00DRAFT_790108 [Zychaea mexicana]KAI9490721.1 hypothetical protein BDB00DRAFT_790108 [Zychaea mexicana]
MLLLLICAPAALIHIIVAVVLFGNRRGSISTYRFGIPVVYRQCELLRFMRPLPLLDSMCFNTNVFSELVFANNCSWDGIRKGSNNFGGHTKRAVAISFGSAVGNAGGIISGQIYVDDDGPYYT